MLRALLLPFAYLPLRLLHGLGALLGWATYKLSARYAQRVRENLRQSGLYPDESSYCRALAAAVSAAGSSVLELPAVWLRPQSQVLKLMRACTGWEHVDAALARGKGIIFLTPHLGCFEITSLYYAARHPITVLYRPPRLAWLEPLMLAGRKRGQVTLAPTDMGGVRSLLAALKRDEAIGLLPDQVPSMGEGVWAEFFGRPAYTMTLAARLQRSTGATILLAYAERLPAGKGYHLHIEPYQAQLPEDKLLAAKELNRAIEGLVARCPAQYLWSYNRYKVPRGVQPPPGASDS
jgi:KDO2-lipid IV(A) lauroyltransferase